MTLSGTHNVGDPGHTTDHNLIDAALAGKLDATAASGTFVPVWKPTTAYTAGQYVLNPSGQIVSANATFTSGASYSASNWTLVSGGGGGLASNIVSKTGAYTAAAGDFVLVNASSGAVTITLPASPSAGQEVAVKKIDGSGNAVTVGGGTVDGDTSVVLSAPLTGAVLVCVGGSAWQIKSAVGAYSGGTPMTSPPNAPTIGTATPGNAQATVAFTPTPGPVATSFSITSSPGGLTATGSSSPLTVTGLTNGTAYTFTVTAVNAAGTSSASAASNSVTPSSVTVPSAPTIGTATPGNAQATVTWTAPASNGGSAITGYTITASPGGATATAAAGATSLTVTGLTNGTAYTFTVTAVNAIGSGVPSNPSNSATPATVPGAPTIGAAAVASSTTATVAYSAPASNGGSAITSYTAISTPSSLTSTGTTSPITVGGLTPGTAYTFTVHATNTLGNSVESAASNSVTPTVPSITAPTSISGCDLWLDAGQVAGATDGAALSSWPDMSGNGYAMTQATAGKRPIYRATGALITAAGQPAVQFDGVDDLLYSSTCPQVQNLTLFVVAKVTASGYHALVGASPGGLELRTDATTNKLTVLRDAVAAETPSTSAYPTGSYSVAEVTKLSTGAGAYYLDGSPVGTFNDTNAFAGTGVIIGASDDPTGSTDAYLGGIAEVVRYNRVLTSTERAQVEAYLRTKHGTP